MSGSSIHSEKSASGSSGFGSTTGSMPQSLMVSIAVLSSTATRSGLTGTDFSPVFVSMVISATSPFSVPAELSVLQAASKSPAATRAVALLVVLKLGRRDFRRDMLFLCVLESGRAQSLWPEKSLNHFQCGHVACTGQQVST